MLFRSLLLCCSLLACAVAGRAQLNIGNANLLGYHSDFQRRPLYCHAGTGFGGGGGGGDFRWNLYPSVGLGYAFQVSSRMYVAVDGTLQAFIEPAFVTGDNRPVELNRRVDLRGAIGLAAFVSTSKHNRDFVKFGLPVLRSRDGFAPTSIGLVSFFGRKGEYLAPERTRGYLADSLLRTYAEVRYGSLYGAQAISIRAGLEAGRFDLTLGTVFGRGDEFESWETHYLDDADGVITGSLGILLRRREFARTQIVAEVAVPFGESVAPDGITIAEMLLSGGVYLRYLYPLAVSRLSISVEGGADLFTRRLSRPSLDPQVDTDWLMAFRGNIGLRYRLGRL